MAVRRPTANNKEQQADGPGGLPLGLRSHAKTVGIYLFLAVNQPDRIRSNNPLSLC